MQARSHPMRRFLSWQLTRLLLGILCVVLLAAAVNGYQRWNENRRTLLALLDEDLREGTTGQRVIRERLPLQAKLTAIRGLIEGVEQAAKREAPSPEARRAAVEAAVARLPEAQRLAREALAAQANSWEAAMLLGATTYLEWSVLRDPRLYTAADRWQEPLLKALREAAGKQEARRFLAIAYLELWPALSVERKAFARDVVAHAFADDTNTFRKLLPHWLAVAASTEEAFAAIPDNPKAWLEVKRTYASRRAWALFLRAHERHLASLEGWLSERLEEAKARKALGEKFYSRSIFLTVVAEAPPDSRFAPLVEEALEQLPRGLRGLSSHDPLFDWLHFVLELAAVGVEPLSPQAINGLVVEVGPAEPYDAALAALVGNDIRQAEYLERLADTVTLPLWGPYLIAKARWLLEQEKLDEAAHTLDRVDRLSRHSMTFALTHAALARAQGDPQALAAAEPVVQAFRQWQWSALAWQRYPRRSVLQLLPAAAAEGVEVDLQAVPAAGAVVRLRWDGVTVGTHIATRGRRLRQRFPITPQAHLLEVSVLAGEEVEVGAVRLLDAAPALP